MRIRRRITAAFAVVVAIPFVVPGSASAATTVNLTLSNFHYCQRDVPVCAPTDQAYTRTASGPEAGSENPNAIVSVHAGDTVVWTYADAACTALAGLCPGHEVRLETPDGTGMAVGPLAPWTGLAPPQATITYTIPAGTPVGTRLYYYCNINAHWQYGMTGILQVAG